MFLERRTGSALQQAAVCVSISFFGEYIRHDGAAQSKMKALRGSGGYGTALTIRQQAGADPQRLFLLSRRVGFVQHFLSVQ